MDQVRFYGAEVAAALAHIHARGVVHRDLKPANILLDREGHCALADFGVATTGSTLRGFRGTVTYMAPELLLKTANSNTESDWWAFGCCLYELNDGKNAVLRGPTAGAVPEDPPRALHTNQSNGRVLDTLLEHFLDKQPSSRAADSDVATCAFFSIVDWDDAASKRLTPPIQPPLPSYVEASQDGSLRFVGDAYRPKKNLPTPKRVTFDEENESPPSQKVIGPETYQREKRHRRTFRGFALNAEVDLAASPRTFARTTTPLRALYLASLFARHAVRRTTRLARLRPGVLFSPRTRPTPRRARILPTAVYHAPPLLVPTGRPPVVAGRHRAATGKPQSVYLARASSSWWMSSASSRAPPPRGFRQSSRRRNAMRAGITSSPPRMW